MTPHCFQSLNNGEQCTAPVPYSYSLFPTPYSLLPRPLLPAFRDPPHPLPCALAHLTAPFGANLFA